MTIIQLEYLLAVAEYQNFTTAATKCFVTQPTLSIQIQKLEEELGVTLFDRSSQPIRLTPIGQKIVSRAKTTLNEAHRIKDIVNQGKKIIEGEFKIGIIPTVMPTLLPMFLSQLVERYPNLELKIEELNTDAIVSKLREHKLDLAIMATPLKQDFLVKKVLYYEPFVAYISPLHKYRGKENITAEDLRDDSLLLLEEGHCFRENILNLCDDNKVREHKNFQIKTGSFETLVNLCDISKGMTMLPYFHTLRMSSEKSQSFYHFKNPQPAREISLVYNSLEFRLHIINALFEVIKSAVIKFSNTKDFRLVSPFSKDK